MSGHRSDPDLVALFDDLGQLGQVVQVDQILGVASRSFIIGRRLWPPAMNRASSPRRARSSIACSTLVARSYSNGDGICILNTYFHVVHDQSVICTLGLK